MKKLSVLLILVMSALMLTAGGKATSYVTIGGKTYFCEKAKPGLINMNLTMDDGTIVKVPLKKVDSYYRNGRLFERLPVVMEGAGGNQTELLEYVTSRNGLRLYKYSTMQEHGELFDNTYKKAHQEFELYVFKDGKLYLQVTRENMGSVLPFFHIQVI
jgi:hypothetical protein